ncbi:hypothetical protein NUSPORA_02221 [Nucleospora cyclopteri]
MFFKNYVKQYKIPQLISIPPIKFSSPNKNLHLHYFNVSRGLKRCIFADMVDFIGVYKFTGTVSGKNWERKIENEDILRINLIPYTRRFCRKKGNKKQEIPLISSKDTFDRCINECGESINMTFTRNTNKESFFIDLLHDQIYMGDFCDFFYKNIPLQQKALEIKVENFIKNTEQSTSLIFYLNEYLRGLKNSRGDFNGFIIKNIRIFERLKSVIEYKIITMIGDRNIYLLYKIVEEITNIKNKDINIINNINNKDLFYSKFIYFRSLKIPPDFESCMKFTLSLKLSKFKSLFYYEVISDIFKGFIDLKNIDEKVYFYQQVKLDDSSKSNLRSKLINLKSFADISISKISKYFCSDLKTYIKYDSFTADSIKKLFKEFSSFISHFPVISQEIIKSTSIQVKSLHLNILLKHFGNLKLKMKKSHLMILEKVYISHTRINELIESKNEVLEAMLEKIAEEYIIRDEEIDEEFKKRMINEK